MTGARIIGWRKASNIAVATLDEVIRELRTPNERGTQRTTVVTLMVLVDDDLVEAARVTEVVGEIVADNPSLVLVVATFPDDEPGIDAQVSVLGFDDDNGSRVCCESVLLRVRGPATRHLTSVVGPCIRPGVPVVAWFPNRLPRSDEPVLATADRVLIDTSRLDDPATVMFLPDLSQRLPITDLAWVRLEPWRRALVELLTGAPFADFVDGVHHIDSQGEPGPRALLAGWLTSRLRLSNEVVRLVDSDRPMLRVRAEHDGRRATFTIDSRSNAGVASGIARIGAHSSQRRRLALPVWSPATVLARALNRPARDVVWEQAAARALELTTRN
jgi:glucose-6-phosphate dehydrogenase assembly protein OpcA